MTLYNQNVLKVCTLIVRVTVNADKSFLTDLWSTPLKETMSNCLSWLLYDSMGVVVIGVLKVEGVNFAKNELTKYQKR